MIIWALLLALVATPANAGHSHGHGHGHGHRHHRQVCVRQPILADPPPCPILHILRPPLPFGDGV